MNLLKTAHSIVMLLLAARLIRNCDTVVGELVEYLTVCYIV